MEKIRHDRYSVSYDNELKQKSDIITKTMFNTCNIEQLRGFSIARSLTFEKYSQLESTQNIPKKKGSLVDLSMDVWQNEILLEVPSNNDNCQSITQQSNNQTISESIMITKPIVVMQNSASTYLDDKKWVNLFCQAFRGVLPLQPYPPIYFWQSKKRLGCIVRNFER